MIQRLSAIELKDFHRATGEWLSGRGPQNGIVISTRIRLARNLSGFPFPPKMDDAQRKEVVEMAALALRGHAVRLDMEESQPIDRSFLVERHLISKELANGDGARAVLFGRGERISIMVNEEDHLRIQCITSGFDLDRTWRALARIDRALSQQLPFAFNQRLGFLTSCPTNVGTGMRVSLMMHLPALTMKEHITKVLRAAENMAMALRGLYGEGTQAFGDFYQVSNQATLGRSEEEIIENIKKLIPVILKYEQSMRDAMLDKERVAIEDRVQRSLATLRAAKAMNVEEMMQHMSMVRMGLTMGLLTEKDITLAQLNELFLLCQPAHLQKHEHRSLTPEERDTLRADIIRRKLAGGESLN